ncbi:M48 family metalloprotease [Paraflavisolibacter sp. H34]|uniref:M48 family metalloprotease n=1 Tax=Huijunlia imazamoxiresistens TaxID=3127457 RepID=UPI00301B0032
MTQALPYHRSVCLHFKQQEKTWNFFAGATAKTEQLQQFKTGLLKNTYKFNPATDQHIYEKVEKARKALRLDHLAVWVYQAQFTEETNATIAYLDGEAHIVFSGQVTQLLNEEELLAVIAHELSHVLLYTLQGGELEIADRIITAIANNYSSEPAYVETARLFRLYTEIFCDRGALAVVGAPDPVITSLVKLSTGLDQVSADSYRKQAEEIFSADAHLKAATVTHPENFIRARAVQLWQDQGEASLPLITKIIEGTADLDQLDIFRQEELTALTRQVLQLFLKPRWFRTVRVLGTARQFFPDFALKDEAVLTNDLAGRVGEGHASVREYLAYLLLDFVLADPSLETVPFGWAFQFAEDLQLKEAFETVVQKEFKFSDKKLQQHKQKSLAAYYEVKESTAEQVYQD